MLELIPSSGGAFEIFLEEEKIYSKLDTGEFPAIEDILKKIASER
ncbi:selenoprotein W-related protein [Alkalicoccus daliensis]|uniref:Selenoprotein W-related protein n=1 Tax=Alkalicoccus daliensis TaxID=745820 RepID=A0A1H0AC97_9BACI|nr:selenoprotein W-related protein [Alkalicoccus daliensis]